MKNIFVCILAVISYFNANSSPLTSSEFAQFRTNLYSVGSNNSFTLTDGTLTQYDTGYSNNVDGMDARKISNPSENFGMLRGNTVLIIERRHTIQNSDTIFFKMWNMRAITYKLEMVAYHLDIPGRIGILKDKFLKTDTPLELNDTTNFNFSVTSNPASWASDRFMIVFTTPSFSALPLTFTSVKAFQHTNSVDINWNTANESNVKQYNIEQSLTGNNFIKLTEIKANNAVINDYQWMDVNPQNGNNYYRISGISIDGKINYSQVIKVYVEKETKDINIYPNPVIGNNLNLQMTNQPPGVYEIKLINLFGQTCMTKSIKHTSLNSTYNLKPDQNISKGIYQLEITTPGGNKKVISIVF